jgi:hypothetical protein
MFDLYRTKESKMKKEYILYLSACLLFISSACKNEVEVSKITGIQCPDCSEVLSADTTTIIMTKKQANNQTTKTSEGYFLYTYTNTVCEACAEQRLIDGKKFYLEGLKSYRAKNYVTAKTQLLAAVRKGYKEAQGLLAKTNKKIMAIEKARKEKALAEEKARKEKIDRAARKAYAKILREHFLDQSMDIKVWVHGAKSQYITLQWALIGDVFMHKFRKGSLCAEMREMGFKRIYLKDGYNYSHYVYWK